MACKGQAVILLLWAKFRLTTPSWWRSVSAGSRMGSPTTLWVLFSGKANKTFAMSSRCNFTHKNELLHPNREEAHFIWIRIVTLMPGLPSNDCITNRSLFPSHPTAEMWNPQSLPPVLCWSSPESWSINLGCPCRITVFRATSGWGVLMTFWQHSNRRKEAWGGGGGKGCCSCHANLGKLEGIRGAGFGDGCVAVTTAVMLLMSSPEEPENHLSLSSIHSNHPSFPITPRLGVMVVGSPARVIHIRSRTGKSEYTFTSQCYSWGKEIVAGG